MSEESLVRHCSPTLAGIKTGNIFTFPYESRETMLESLRIWNRRLGKKGLRVIPLRFRAGVALLYVYRPSRLSRDLEDELVRRMLVALGYAPENPHKCLLRLRERIGENGEFPHEIGFFLGYPPEDVRGFIEDREHFRFAGMWKVYGDVEKAQKLFSKYKKCAAVYADKLKTGVSVEKLTVCG